MCVICEHTSVTDINADLRNGVPLLRIENAYGVARASLHRHRDGGHHLSSAEMEVYSALGGVDIGENEMDTSEELEELEAPAEDTEGRTSNSVPVDVAEPEPETESEPVFVPTGRWPGAENSATLPPSTSRLVAEEQARLAQARRAEKAKRQALEAAAAIEPEPQPEVDIEQLRALQAFAKREYPLLSPYLQDQVRVIWEALGWSQVSINGFLRGGDRERGSAYLEELRTSGKVALWLAAHGVILSRYHEVLAAAEAAEA